MLSLNPRLSFEPLIRPPFLQGEETRWIDESVERFIRRVNEMGDPNNRYMLYGFNVWSEDLFKLDQTIWKIRRHCRPLKESIRAAERTIEIDWVERLRKAPGDWRLGSNLPIERALDGKRSREVSEALLTLNSPFDPGREHDYAGWRTSSKNPPMADWFWLLQNEKASPEVRHAAELKIKWALENVRINDNDRDKIQAILAKYRSSISQKV